MTDGLTDLDDALSSDEARVFLSYSRKDRERAQSIADALRNRKFGVYRDTDDILPTEEWRTRLEELIAEADTIVFLLSPHSAASEVCAWEVEYATSLNKRIAPIVIDDVDGDTIPPLLARLNFIFCTPRDPFENAVETLVSALNTDIDWIREQTRLSGLARRWNKAGRPSRFLLRGQDIADAETWRDSRPDDAPPISALQAAYIAESRRAATGRQRTWIGGSLSIAAAAAALAVFSYFQSVEADRQRDIAETERALAIEARDVAQRSESLFLAAESNKRSDDRKNAEALAFAYAAMPHDPDLSDRPLVSDAEIALNNSLSALRLRMVFSGENINSHGAALSSDGLRLVTGDRNGGAHIWDIETGEKLRSLAGPAGDAVRVAFSPDGAQVAAGFDDGSVRLYNTNDGEELAVFEGHGKPISALKFSPDGRKLLSGSHDTTIRIRDIAGASEAIVLTEHTDFIRDMSVSPDGSRLLSSAKDSSVRLWDMDTGEQLTVFPKHDGDVRTAAFGHDARTIATYDGRVRKWRLDSSEPVKTVEGFENTSVFAAAFSPQLDRVVTSNEANGRVGVWDTTTGEAIASLRAFRDVSDLVFADDGQSIIAVLFDGRVLHWDLVERSHVPGSEALLKPYAFGARARTSPHHGRLEQDGTLHITSMIDGSLFARLPFGELELRGFSVSPKGDRIATWTSDRSVRVWDRESGAVIAQFSWPDHVLTGLEFSPDGSRLVSVWLDPANSGRSSVRVWDTMSGTLIRQVTGEDDRIVLSASFGPDGRTVFTGYESGGIREWDIETGDRLRSLRGQSGQVGALIFSSDGTLMLSVSFLRSTARIWNLQRGQAIADYDFEYLLGDNKTILNARFGDDGTRLFVDLFEFRGYLGRRSYRVWPDTAQLVRRAGTITERLQPLSVAERCQFNFLPPETCDSVLETEVD